MIFGFSAAMIHCEKSHTKTDKQIGRVSMARYLEGGKRAGLYSNDRL